ncbi:hypothetical protein GOODEAATRI_030139, partial [Goodea atripinnis]
AVSHSSWTANRLRAGSKHTRSPPMLSPYTPCAAPALVSTFTASVTPNATEPLSMPNAQTLIASTFPPQTSVHRPMVAQPPQSPSCPNFPETQISQQPTMNHLMALLHPRQCPHQLGLCLTCISSPHARFSNTTTNEHDEYQYQCGQIHHTLIPLHSSVNNAWGPALTSPSPLNISQAAFDYTTPFHAHVLVHLQPSESVSQPALWPLHFTYPMHAPTNSPATAIPTLPLAAYGGFLQTHQEKNVQVFTGNADSKMLVEDWIHDIQYLLEAIERPLQLRFPTVVLHLGGQARKLILNLPPQNQTPQMAFDELRAEYSNTQGSLDPLADFYECSQRSGESVCSYAIALEATLQTELCRGRHSSLCSAFKRLEPMVTGATMGKQQDPSLQVNKMAPH